MWSRIIKNFKEKIPSSASVIHFIKISFSYIVIKFIQLCCFIFVVGFMSIATCYLHNIPIYETTLYRLKYLKPLIVAIIEYFRSSSVLEEFTIVKFPLMLGVFSTTWTVDLFLIKKMLINRYVELKDTNFIKQFIKKIFVFFQSFFLPNIFSTKNYVYGRIMIFSVKCYFRLFTKHKLLLFWRSNIQVLKVKIQLKFQELVKSNFGHNYPFYTRLLNFYPYFLVIFFSILFHNFNGLLFYGSLIQHFYYKILYYHFSL